MSNTNKGYLHGGASIIDNDGNVYNYTQSEFQVILDAEKDATVTPLPDSVKYPLLDCFGVAASDVAVLTVASSNPATTAIAVTGIIIASLSCATGIYYAGCISTN